MSRFALVGTCSRCAKTSGPGRVCCGLPVHVVVAPEPPKRASFGSGPRKKLPPINRERRARVRPAQFGDQARLCRLVGCAIPRCTANPLTTKIEPDHATTRGAGGLDSSCWPLCPFHHRQRHQIGLATFEAKHGVSSAVVAGRMQELAAAHDCPSWPDPAGKTCLVCLRVIPEGAP